MFKDQECHQTHIDNIDQHQQDAESAQASAFRVVSCVQEEQTAHACCYHSKQSQYLPAD